MKTIKDSDKILERIHANKPMWVLVSGRTMGQHPIGLTDLLFQKGLIKEPTENDADDLAKITVEWNRRYESN